MNFIKRVPMGAAAGVLAVGAAGAAALIAPAAAHAANITGAGTSVTVTGSAGDTITQGNTFSYTPSNTTHIYATASTDGNSVSVTELPSFWTLDFAAPQGQALTAGTTYNNVTEYPSTSPTTPGLSVIGNGHTCSTVTGSLPSSRPRSGRMAGSRASMPPSCSTATATRIRRPPARWSSTTARLRPTWP
jgi:hypothetical protein